MRSHSIFLLNNIIHPTKKISYKTITQEAPESQDINNRHWLWAPLTIKVCDRITVKSEYRLPVDKADTIQIQKITKLTDNYIMLLKANDEKTSVIGMVTKWFIKKDEIISIKQTEEDQDFLYQIDFKSEGSSYCSFWLESDSIFDESTI